MEGSWRHHACTPATAEVRAKAGDFITLCTTPELAVDVTMQPIRRSYTAADYNLCIQALDVLGAYLMQGDSVTGSAATFHKEILERS